MFDCDPRNSSYQELEFEPMILKYMINH